MVAWRHLPPSEAMTIERSFKSDSSWETEVHSTIELRRRIHLIGSCASFIVKNLEGRQLSCLPGTIILELTYINPN